VFVLIDIRHEPQAIDVEFLNWLGTSSIPFSIVFTKADKISTQKIKENVGRYMSRLEEDWEVLPPYFVTSSEKKIGREEMLEYIDQINKLIADGQ
jgi:GTP-binding protein